MNTYQGSDWFKSGSFVKVTAAESKIQLVHQAAQQIADSSRKLQVAYDEGLALFSNNFSGTDAQILEAQQTLAAILAVSQTLQDLHKRLASSMMSSTSDSAIDYIADKPEQTPGVLALLKSKELQLQVQVDKCAQLRAENVLLHKRLQTLSNPTSRQNSNRLEAGELPGSIPAGPVGSAWSASDMERLPSSPNHNSPLILNGVLSLANAGTWLQMLRSKLSPQTSHRRRTQTADVQDIKDGAASDCMAFDQDEAEDFTYSLPIRRSRSDALYDRQINSTVSRRGAELPRTSSVGAEQNATLEDESLRFMRERDQRRRTNVLMDDAASADQGSKVQFLTPELAARSALFGNRRRDDD